MKKIIILLLFVFPCVAYADFVDQLINDMGNNDAKLMNAPNTDWSKHGYLDMGFPARGDATPESWAKAQGSKYTNSASWNAVLPWFQIWPVEGNSGNSRVKVSDIRVQMLIGNKWQVIDMPDNQWAQLEPWSLIGGKGGVQQRDEGNGSFSYLVNNSGPIHGGLGKFDMKELGVDPTKIQGVAISANAEIIEGDGVILFEIGGDYYPNTGVQVEDYKLQWGPAIGGSKFAMIDGKRCLYMTTINPPGQGDSSKFAKSGGKTALTHEELRANPPHNFCDDAPPLVVTPAPTPTPTPAPTAGKVNGNRVINTSNRIINNLELLIKLYQGKRSDEIESQTVITEAEIVIDKLEYLKGLYQ